MQRDSHPLRKLEGVLERGYSIKVARKQIKKAEQIFFQVFLVDNSGEESQQPVFEGLYSLGIEPYIDGWIDGHYYEDVRFKGRELNLSGTGLDFKLFKKLGKTLKPSWSFMVAYEAFGKAGNKEVKLDFCPVQQEGVCHH